MCPGDSADPQSPTFELHEVVGHSAWADHQLPRVEADRWGRAPDPARSQSLSENREQKETKETKIRDHVWTTERAWRKEWHDGILRFLRCLGVENPPGVTVVLLFRRNKIFAMVFLCLDGIFEA